MILHVMNGITGQTTRNALLVVVTSMMIVAYRITTRVVRVTTMYVEVRGWMMNMKGHVKREISGACSLQ